MTTVAATEHEDMQAEDLEALLAKIADQMSVLSNADESPGASTTTSGSFEPEEIDFQSGDWLLRLIHIQAWLHLSDEITQEEAEQNPVSAATALFRGIDAESPDTCTVETDGVAILSADGADILSNYLDTAVRLFESYIEDRESFTPQQSATRWSESWDEVDTGPALLEPIKAETTIWPIQEFSDKAVKGKLNLSPTYQRGDVWKVADAQKLIESVLRGIPLPSIIILKPQSKGVNAVYEVVDGKQRLTSILRFIGKHPVAMEHVQRACTAHPDVDFKLLFETDYKKFRRQWKRHMGETLNATKEAEYYFPFRLPKDSPALKGTLDVLQGKYYYEIRDVPIQIGPEQETVQEVFESVSRYKIPLIEYIDAKPHQVHEVFHLYNRQGKHLNAEEIRNALFHELDLMKLLLIAAGDHVAVDQLAHFVPAGERDQLQQIAATLTRYKFGVSRYKRMKLLSWLVSLVAQPGEFDSDGKLAIRSTAKQIDAMLKTAEEAVKGKGPAFMVSHDGLRMLLGDLAECVDAHSSFSGWADEFKDDKLGTKWEELPLVASLAAVFLIAVASEDALDVLEANEAAVRDFTKGLQHSDKGQSKTQWGFIGRVVTGILETVSLDAERVGAAMQSRYGVDPVRTLQAASTNHRRKKR